MTEDEMEELNAAMYYIKNSDDQDKIIESAKYILRSDTDKDVLNKILVNLEMGILKAENEGQLREAKNKAYVNLETVMAQLFVNAFRMGRSDMYNHMKNIQNAENAATEENTRVIGEPAE